MPHVGSGGFPTRPEGDVAPALTAWRARHYSLVSMSAAASVPLETEITRLSNRVDELLAALEQLREENRALRQRHESLNNERATLLQKNEQVRTRVEAMIGRLKTLEHGA